jgi:hypothetical protein
MFLVWLQSRCSPQGHPPSTFLFLSSLFKQQIRCFHDSADRPGRGQGQTGFRLSGEAERRSLARRRGGDGEPVSVLYNGPWFTRSKPRGDGRASSPAEADHELLLVRGGFWHRPKRRASNRDSNPCRVFQGRRSSFFSSALPQAASGPGGAGSRSLGAWRERRGRAGAALRLGQYGDQPAKFKTSTRVFPLFRAFKDGSQGIVPRASWSACP